MKENNPTDVHLWPLCVEIDCHNTCEENQPFSWKLNEEEKGGWEEKREHWIHSKSTNSDWLFKTRKTNISIHKRKPLHLLYSICSWGIHLDIEIENIPWTLVAENTPLSSWVTFYTLGKRYLVHKTVISNIIQLTSSTDFLNPLLQRDNCL